MNITEKMQVVVDEITLDVTDFLRNLIGENNDDITRAFAVLALEKYLANFEDVDAFQVVCDDTNNPLENMDTGRLSIDILFVVDYISMRGNFIIQPGVSHYVDIVHEFYVRVNKADLQVEKQMIDLVTLPADSTRSPFVNKLPQDYNEMPVSLASTLGY